MIILKKLLLSDIKKWTPKYFIRIFSSDISDRRSADFSQTMSETIRHVRRSLEMTVFYTKNNWAKWNEKNFKHLLLISQITASYIFFANSALINSPSLYSVAFFKGLTILLNSITDINRSSHWIRKHRGATAIIYRAWNFGKPLTPIISNILLSSMKIKKTGTT